MAGKDIRVGLIGAGYIASWHAEAIKATRGVRLVAVCDPAPGAAAALAHSHGAQAFDSMEAMLAGAMLSEAGQRGTEQGGAGLGGVGQGGAHLDAVHVLTPPHLHCAHALRALQAGAHVLVEKPFALGRAEAEVMVAAAQAANRQIAVNHNFLALPAYLRLKAALAAGVPGRIDSADIRWRYPLAPLRSGPYGLWLLRSPQNLLLELGPHLFAFAQDLFGPLTQLDLRTSNPIALPGGGELPRNWQIRGRAGRVDVTLHLSLVEGAEDRSVELHGVAGTARLDYGADVLVMARPNASDIVMNPLRSQMALAGQHLGEGLRNAARQLGSLNRQSPYGLGFRGTIAAFYAAIAAGRAVDARFSGASAVEVITGIERALLLLPAVKAAPVPAPAPVPQVPAPVPAVQTRMLVIGGTGFIGRALTRNLVAAGYAVRVLSRGRANPFADLGTAVEIVAASLTDPIELRLAMQGIDTVFHLAKAEESSWEGYLQNDVAVTEAIATAAVAGSVRRLVYTGTIASYDASHPGQPVTEATDFGPMESRNLYARSKALCEQRLLARYREAGLPLVIARPGIVVGPGGPLQHWGIGRWHGAGAVRIWGQGRNVLPFVLISDVADGLRRMALVPGIEGQSFNLIGEPLLSARGYFAAIHRLTGTKIRVSSGNLVLFHLGDCVKYALKRFVLRKTGLTRPLLVDWRSRAHLSPFHNDRAKAVLNWQPEAEAEAFARRAVDHVGLFGF